MLRKKLCLYLTAVMIFASVLTGCGKENMSLVAEDTGTAVSSAAEEESTEEESTEEAVTPDEESGGEEAAEEEAEELQPAIDFSLEDQYGNRHALSDYKGKTVFLNFWATWCPPCRSEMPDIQALYDEYMEAGDDSVVILGVAAPNFGSEQDRVGIEQFLSENGYTYPVLMDMTGEVFAGYYISSYPTTYMINTDGNVYGYISGALPQEMMREIIAMTVENRPR